MRNIACFDVGGTFKNLATNKGNDARPVGACYIVLNKLDCDKL